MIFEQKGLPSKDKVLAYLWDVGDWVTIRQISEELDMPYDTVNTSLIKLLKMSIIYKEMTLKNTNSGPLVGIYKVKRFEYIETYVSRIKEKEALYE